MFGLITLILNIIFFRVKILISYGNFYLPLKLWMRLIDSKKCKFFTFYSADFSVSQ